MWIFVDYALISFRCLYRSGIAWSWCCSSRLYSVLVDTVKHFSKVFEAIPLPPVSMRVPVAPNCCQHFIFFTCHVLQWKCMIIIITLESESYVFSHLWNRRGMIVKFCTGKLYIMRSLGKLRTFSKVTCCYFYLEILDNIWKKRGLLCLSKGTTQNIIREIIKIIRINKYHVQVQLILILKEYPEE